MLIHLVQNIYLFPSLKIIWMDNLRLIHLTTFIKKHPAPLKHRFCIPFLIIFFCWAGTNSHNLIGIKTPNCAFFLGGAGIQRKWKIFWNPHWKIPMIFFLLKNIFISYCFPQLTHFRRSWRFLVKERVPNIGLVWHNCQNVGRGVRFQRIGPWPIRS